MRRAAALLLILLAACAPAIASSSRPIYVTRPLRSVHDDSTLAGVVAFLDERLLIWMNAGLLRGRRDLLEGGSCLRIAAVRRPDGFFLDSIVPPDSVREPTLIGAKLFCPAGTAPMHWHVITPALGPYLAEHGDPDGVLVARRCEISEPDRRPEWSRYALNVMQCGLGVDSIVAYRVKRR